VREALEAVLPDDLDRWMECAAEARNDWLARGVPIEARRPLLLEALNALYARKAAAGNADQPRRELAGAAGTR
jgi:siroheme synthase (precorrin-2 oxidase/ferrochelatase)